MYANKGIHAYKKDSLRSDLASASPHRVIQLLMQGALERIALGKGCIERKDFMGKGTHLSRATEIINALRDALERDANPELVDNLDALYLYMVEQIALASSEMSTEKLDHVSSLILTIKESWDQISDA